MIAAVVALAVALVVSGGAVVTLTLAIRSLVASVSAANERARVTSEEQLKQERSMDEAEDQRDAAIAKCTAAQAAADKAIGQLAQTQLKLNAAAAQLVEKTSGEVLTADSPKLLEFVNGLLGKPLGGS